MHDELIIINNIRYSDSNKVEGGFDLFIARSVAHSMGDNKMMMVIIHQIFLNTVLHIGHNN